MATTLKDRAREMETKDIEQRVRWLNSYPNKQINAARSAAIYEAELAQRAKAKAA